MIINHSDRNVILGTLEGLEAAVGSLPARPNRAPLGPPRREPRSRDWCFTWNNYTSAEESLLENVGIAGGDRIQYLVFGREGGGTTGRTAHLQGFIQLKHPTTRGGVQRILCSDELRRRTIHLEQRVGTPEQAANYCKKEGDFDEYGRIASMKQGSRNDLTEFVETVRNEGPLTRAQMLKRFPLVLAKYPRFVEIVFSEYEEIPDIPNHPLRGWQAEMGEQLKRNPDPRKIYFVVDPVGNAGKSWFADYWTSHHPRCLIMHPAKHGDMALVLKQTRPKPRVVFIDCPREKLDFFSYTFLEDLKNGRVFSTKYESTMITMKVPHVIVLMNQDPDGNKLSGDRYAIVRV